MKARASAGGMAVLGAVFLFGCAQIVGIGDLGDAGSSGRTGSSSGGTMGTGSCNPPASAPCQIDPQCGCAAGQKCDFNGSTTPSCVAAGLVTSGGLCAAVTDCAAGLVCIGLVGGGGVCHPYCNVAGSPCPATSSGPAVNLCIQVNSDDVPVPQAEYCLFDCTPLPNNCPAGQACVVDQVAVATGAVNTTNCEVPGSGVPGETCATDGNLDCQAGSECASSVCAQFCRTASDCVGVGTGACDTAAGVVLNGITYGFCE